MTIEELNAFEAKMKHQSNCPLNPAYFFHLPPVTGEGERGYNVLHFNTGNRPNKSNLTEAFIKNELKNAVRCKSDVDVMLEAVRRSRVLNHSSRHEGVYLEFGFCTGRSINFIAALGYDKTVFGFDSANGLPEAWEGKKDRFPAGTFRYLKSYKIEKNKDGNEDVSLFDRSMAPALDPFIPFMPFENVRLIVGLIRDTLPDFVNYSQVKEYGVELIHIDSDLLSSCETIYSELEEFIVPDKTVIVLDEGYNWIGQGGEHDAWKYSEMKATLDFAEKNHYRINYIAYNYNHQQLALTFSR